MYNDLILVRRFVFYSVSYFIQILCILTVVKDSCAKMGLAVRSGSIMHAICLIDYQGCECSRFPTVVVGGYILYIVVIFLWDIKNPV